MTAPRPRTVPRPTPVGIVWTASGTLPPELLEQSCRRVSIASVFFALGWATVLGLYFLFHANGAGPTGSAAWPMPGVPVAIAGVVLSLAMAVWAHGMHAHPRLVLDVGLLFEIATAALIGFQNQWIPAPRSGDISWVCAIVLAYPAIAPTTPGRTLLTAFVAASMDPLWYGIATLRGAAPDASVPDFVLRFWPNALTAVAAIVPTQVIRGLGHHLSRARELGSYQLGSKIGTGGMGEVYHAQHRLLARPAAIKVIRPELLRSTATGAAMHIERFRREAEAAALLRSPHTIQLYDFGVSDDGGFYYVMELLDGMSFDELVSRTGPLPAERAVHLMLQACHSLGEAHARGLIHRDLKPSNLFTCRVGRQLDYVKVLDFGLVKVVDSGDPTLTAPNIAAGTPAFMAPEVALGDQAIDCRIDIYSLGCVFYWLLTGRFVFEAQSAGRIMHLHIQETPEPPSRRTELDVPPTLDELVMACLAKDPADRPADGDVLRCRLRDLGLAQQWTEDRAQRWWDANKPDAIDLGLYDGRHLVRRADSPSA
jgi:tRNA A-37 threonylcarbamoyl transferase component Bud32